MRKKYVAMMLAAILGISTAFAAGGCGQNDSEEKQGEQGNSEENEEDITLRFMWWGDDVRHEATLAVIEQYEEAHPNVTIEAEYGGYDGYFEKLTTQLSGGTAADIIQYNANTVTDLMAIGDVFVNLEDYSDVLDTSGFNQDFVQNFSYYDGKMIALPTGVNGGIWLANTALFDEVGIDPESIVTWDDFIAAGKKMHEANSSYYLFNIDIETLGKELLGSIMAQITGEDMIDVDTYEMNFTKEDLLTAFTLIEEMYDNNVLEPAADSAPYSLKINTNPKWINHELAVAYGATSNIYDGYYDFKDTAAALDMPVFEDAKETGILYVPPQMMAISSTCEHPEVAADFLNYFFNDETALDTLKGCRSIPPTEKGQQICEEKGYIDPVLVTAVEKAAETGTAHQNIYTPTEVVEILQDATEKIAYDQGDAQSITEETMTLLEETLNRLKG
ncbi:hypothetical protein B5F07_10465 [Lachnoclostridium sp. An169]|uniref:ABC transporter substrate-binding protein n=1 Tax=Lachnoclostridium sp. An169 TaxID=1965569 RepID=UPI000B3996CF|nr:ABC transporter substrate-binding protein [Lachnoclostridium sp. An169]OUP83393.1 hypothetical protein B5F07_10465 [Lachnoclostridium sp. An169]